MKKLLLLLLTVSVTSCMSQEKNMPNTFDFGTLTPGLYSNDYFDIEVSYDSTWVIQNQEQLNDLVDLGGELITGDDKNLKAVFKAAQVNTAYLLTIFKYEVGSAVPYNPSFMIVAENIKNAPGVKTGKDYLFHVKKLLQQSQLEYYFEKDTYSKEIGGSTYYVLEASIDYMDQTIKQEYISTVSNGFTLSYILSYTTESEKAELYAITESIE